MERSKRFAGQRKRRLYSKKDMKNSELKEYLNAFSDDADISLILANPRKRKLYEVERVDFITDMEQPVFCVTVLEAKDMDSDMIAACEEDERNGEKSRKISHRPLEN